MTRERKLLVVAALATVYLVWGSTYLALWIMVEEMPPLLGSGLRALTAGTLLAFVLAATRRGWRSLRVTRQQLAGCALIGLLLPVLGQGLVTIAEDGGAPSGVTALLIAAVPLWIAAYRAMSGDRPSATTLMGVLVGFAGAGILIAHDGIAGSAPTWALLTVVVASMAWAFGSWLLPRLALPSDPFVLVVYEMLVGGSILCVLGAAGGEHFSPTEYSMRAWGAWAFLVVVGSIIAFSAYAWLLQTTPVSVVSTYAYVSPVVAVFLGWMVLSEPVTTATIAAAAIIVSGVALVVSSELPGRKEPR